MQEKTLPEGSDIDSVQLPLATNARAKMSDLRDGFVKIFARRSTGVVVGGVVVRAPGASELVLPITLAVSKASPSTTSRRRSPSTRRCPGRSPRPAGG